MPTIISINLKDSINQPLQTSVSFTLVGEFTSEPPSVVIGTTKTVTTDVSGLGTVSLSVGSYVVRVLDRQWTIGVIGTGTANLIDLSAATIPVAIPSFGLATISSLLAGLSTATNAVITAGDSILTAFGKVQAQITTNIANINLKANIAGQVFTGNISAPNLSGSNSGDQDLSSLATTTSVALKADIASPVFTGSAGFGGATPLAIIHARGGNVTGIRIQSTAACAILDFFNTKFTYSFRTNFNADGFELLRSTVNAGSPVTTIAHFTEAGNMHIGGLNATARLQVTNSTGFNQFRLVTSYTPTSSADTNGNIGDVAWDTGFIYIKTANSATGWKRSALVTF